MSSIEHAGSGRLSTLQLDRQPPAADATQIGQTMTAERATPVAMLALADSGAYIDWYDIEKQLIGEGYSPDDVRQAFADADVRRELNERCDKARRTAEAQNVIARSREQIRASRRLIEGSKALIASGRARPRDQSPN